MITIQYAGSKNCPVFLCDVCGEQIQQDGNVLWRHENPGELRFTHKHCNSAFKKAHGPDWDWLPLPAFLVYLWRNTAIDGGKAKRVVELLAHFEEGGA
ncbi:MAG: hypothetical protein K6U04_05450 [Armatimonadetes bacterium]|nr:hypothetical protein [Armatimonadota bacterium]